MMRPYFERDGITIYHGRWEDVLPHLTERIDLLCGDPPYGINYQHGTRKGGRKLGTDGMSIVGDTKPFDPSPWLHYPKVILWGANHYADKLPSSRGWLTWDKRDGIDPNDQSDCEHAWTNWLTVARLFSRYWNGGGSGEARWHPNQKPIALMRWCLELAPGAAMTLDPWMGSGTTLRAALDLGRKAIGIELEERYCEIAAKRLSQMVLPMEVPA